MNLLFDFLYIIGCIGAAFVGYYIFKFFSFVYEMYKSFSQDEDDKSKFKHP